MSDPDHCCFLDGHRIELVRPEAHERWLEYLQCAHCGAEECDPRIVAAWKARTATYRAETRIPDFITGAFA